MQDDEPKHGAGGFYLWAGPGSGNRRALLRAHPAEEALHPGHVPR